MATFRYATKRLLGPTLTHRLADLKQSAQRWLAGLPGHSTSIEENPWCSPNTFGFIEAACARAAPAFIHEYGAGASTICHLKRLLRCGGTLVSVEHDEAWANRVRVAAKGALQVRDTAPLGVSGAVGDFDWHSRALNGTEVRFVLKVRTPRSRSADPDGTAEEFADYVATLDQPADVVVVDGRARKACIRYVLDNRLLRPGGALALFEAGRGVDGWLDAPALTGTSNYQPEVERMIRLGAKLIDGTGYDTWPGQTHRRSFGSLSRHYPMELCLLQLPEGAELGSIEASGTTTHKPPATIARIAP